MLILAIITGTLALACGIGWIVSRVRDGYEGNDWLALGFWVLGAVWIISLLTSTKVSFATENLTGYIYSADTKFGYTTAHIRFSEQAGQDVQPSFCVKSDSEPGRQILELAGSSKKVKVNIPPYFYFSNNPFACGTTDMKIQVVSEE